jgi:hypothetical protein
MTSSTIAATPYYAVISPSRWPRRARLSSPWAELFTGETIVLSGGEAMR